MATASSNESTINLSLDHFNCNICFEFLRDPVQCVWNEHYFCKQCITRHLTRSQTCPVCQDDLTASTLCPSPRIVANFLQQFQSLRCRCANQICTPSVTCEVLLSHHEGCGFAPVRCSNTGCEETVNRQDLASHERESCEFRPVTCEESHERMNQKEYGRHSCFFLTEIDKNKFGFVEVLKILREIQDEQLRLRQDVEMHLLTLGVGELNSGQSGQGDDLRRQGSGVTQPSTTQEQQRNDSEDALISRNLFGAVGSLSSQVQIQPAARDRQFVVAGGGSISYEVFNWSTQRWTLYENSLFYDHNGGFSFVYDNKIMICGGTSTNRVECLDMTNPRSASAFPMFLPSADCGKGVLSGDKILTFGESISATLLEPPYITEVQKRYYPSVGNKIKLCSYGVSCVNENAVAILGGYKVNSKDNNAELTDDVRLYNPTTKQLKKLAPLPYKVASMAVLAHNDNVIILGGESRFALNDVIMYSIKTQQCSKLPNMLEKRTNCEAVIMGETIIAIGGSVGRSSHKTAEYLVLGENTWRELPEMHCVRDGATACVLP